MQHLRAVEAELYIRTKQSLMKITNITSPCEHNCFVLYIFLCIPSTFWKALCSFRGKKLLTILDYNKSFIRLSLNFFRENIKQFITK